MSDADLYVKGFEDLKNELADCRQRVEQKVQDLVRWVRDIDTIESRKGRANIGNELRELSGRPKLRSTEYGIDRREDIKDLLEDPQRIVPEARSRYIARDISRISELAGRLLLGAFSDGLIASPSRLWLLLKTLSSKAQGQPETVWRQAVGTLGESQMNAHVSQFRDGWEDTRATEASLDAITKVLTNLTLPIESRAACSAMCSQYVWRKMATSVWEFRFENEHGQRAHCKGYEVIWRLLAAPPQKGVAAVELLEGSSDIAARNDTSTPAADAKALKAVRNELKETEAKLKIERSTERIEELQAQAEQYRDYLSKTQRPGGELKSLGSLRDRDRARAAVHGNLKRAYKALLEDADRPMKGLVEHLRSSIRAVGDSFQYDPRGTTLNWELH